MSWSVNGLHSDSQSAVAAAALFVIALFLCKIPEWNFVTIALFFFTAVTTLHGSSHVETLRSFLSIVAFTAGLTLCNAENERAVRRTILAGAAILVAIGLFQRFVLFPALIPMVAEAARNFLEQFRVFSTFALPSQFSAYLAVVTPLAVTGVLIGRRIVSVPVAMLIIVAFTLPVSMAGPVAAAGACFYLFGRGRQAYAVVGVSIIILGAIVLQRVDLAGIGPVTLRLYTWKATLAGWLNAPLIGHGTGSFAELYAAKYVIPGADLAQHPHNWGLKVLFENGILGFAFWLAAVCGFFTKPRHRAFRAAALAFLIASCFDVADLSWTLRSLAFFLLGASMYPHSPRA